VLLKNRRDVAVPGSKALKNFLQQTSDIRIRELSNSLNNTLDS